MLSTLLYVWALPSMALAGAVPGTGSAVGSSLRGATEPPSQLPEVERVENSTTASQAQHGGNSTDENSTEEVEAVSLSGMAYLSGWYSLRNYNSWKFMVVNCWFNCHSGVTVTQHDYNSLMSDNLKWHITHQGNGVHMLKSARGGYLAIRGGDESTGAKAEINDHYGPAAQWMIYCQNAACSLRNVRSRRYLKILSASKDNDAQVVQWNKWSASSPEYQWNLAAF